MSTVSNRSHRSTERLPSNRPLQWLARGWDDLWHAGSASLAYGVIVAVMGALILGFGQHPYFVAAALSAFLLIAPIVSTGLCELSRLREAGEPVSFDASLEPLARNRNSLLSFGGVLLAVSVTWFLVSDMVLRLVLGAVPPSVGDALWGSVLAQLSLDEIAAYLLAGAGLAAIVFALSVVTVPRLLDRGGTAAAAMQESLYVTLAQLPAMLVWAALIVALTAIGFATLLFGLVVIFPLLGHATWHAYRDLMG